MSVLTILDSNKTVFLCCDCKNEILMIDYDHELKIADFAIYEHRPSVTHKLSLWQRIRYALRTLIYGKPYGDQMVLGHKQLKELHSFLGGLDLKV